MSNDSKNDAEMSGVAPHHHVPPCMSWSLLLSLFVFVVLPATILAAEGTGGTPPPLPPPPPSGGGQMGPPPGGMGGGQMAPPPGGMPSGDMGGGQQGQMGMPPGGMPGQNGMPGQQGMKDQKGNMMPSAGMDQKQGMPMQPGMAGQQMQPQMGGADQQGQMDAQQKAQQAMMLKGMQQGMASFGSQLTRIKARIATLEKKGVKAPSDLTEALAKADDLISKVKAAQSYDEVDALDVPGTMQDVGDALREQLPNLERLANLTKIYTTIEGQIKTLDRQLAADKALAKRSKIDLSDVVAAFETDLTKLKAAYAADKAKIAVGDVEEGFDLLQQDVFDAMDSVGEHHAVIQQMSRLSATISQADRDLKQKQKQLDGLKRKKLNTAAAQAILDTAKGKLADLKAAASAKPADPDVMTGILQDLQDIGDQFNAEVNGLNGIQTTSAIDAGLQIPGFTLPDFSSLGGSTGTAAR